MMHGKLHPDWRPASGGADPNAEIILEERYDGKSNLRFQFTIIRVVHDGLSFADLKR